MVNLSTCSVGKVLLDPFCGVGTILQAEPHPNADRLVSVQFIDPTSRTIFGVNNQVFALDFTDMRQHTLAKGK